MPPDQAFDPDLVEPAPRHHQGRALVEVAAGHGGDDVVDVLGHVHASLGLEPRQAVAAAGLVQRLELLVQLRVDDLAHVGVGHHAGVGRDVGEFVRPGGPDQGEILKSADISGHEARPQARYQDAAGRDQEESGTFCHIGPNGFIRGRTARRSELGSLIDRGRIPWTRPSWPPATGCR